MARREKEEFLLRSSAHLALGRLGEELTAGWLYHRGFEILARNWRSFHCEMDIIARKNGIVAFVEVKTRTRGHLVSPLEAIGHVKRQRLLRAAWAWMDQAGAQEQPRFDVAAVVVDRKSRVVSFEYIESAFDGSDWQ